MPAAVDVFFLFWMHPKWNLCVYRRYIASRYRGRFCSGLHSVFMFAARQFLSGNARAFSGYVPGKYVWLMYGVRGGGVWDCGECRIFSFLFGVFYPICYDVSFLFPFKQETNSLPDVRGSAADFHWFLCTIRLLFRCPIRMYQVDLISRISIYVYVHFAIWFLLLLLFST